MPVRKIYIPFATETEGDLLMTRFASLRSRSSGFRHVYLDL